MKRLILITMLMVGSGLTIEAQTNPPTPTRFSVYLRGANEVPPNRSPVTGLGWFALDGNMLNFAFGGFSPWFGSSIQELNGGIYGPAPIGCNGPVIFANLGWSLFVPEGLTYGGGFELTPEQVTELQAGLWYVNVKSPSFPNGEVRGQICSLTPDSDCDADGVPDVNDLCLNTGPGEAVDGNGCSIEQLAPCEGPWKDHHEYVKAIKEVAKQFSKERLITKKEEKLIVKQAERSNCGNPPRGPFFHGGFSPLPFPDGGVRH